MGLGVQVSIEYLLNVVLTLASKSGKGGGEEKTGRKEMKRKENPWGWV